MPIVELVAKKIIDRNPGLGVSVIDLIVLLWMYTNPYDSNRRELSSMKNILRMTDIIRSVSNGVTLTDEELTQVVFASLDRLRKNGLVYIQSAGRIFVKGTLTERGVQLIEQSLPTPELRRVTEEFGDNP